MKKKLTKKQCKKIGHATREEALIVRRKMIERGDIGAETLRAYLCPYCSGAKRWHLGTPE